MTLELYYWSADNKQVNFGDYISLYLYEKLIKQNMTKDQILLLGVGSILNTPLLTKVLEAKSDLTELHVWGSGARSPNGPKLSWLKTKIVTHIYGVRGYHTARSLNCTPELAIGDPAFLLPTLIRPGTSLRGKYLTFVPHISQCNTSIAAESLLLDSHCERLLKPLIDPTPDALENFVDELCSSSFILTNSLHGAILAQAYGIPYAYGKVGGYLNCPFKWKDHSSIIGVECCFASNINQAKDNFTYNFARGRTPSAHRILTALPRNWLSSLALDILSGLQLSFL
jgi:succinoglycan biosynthesis protein ExoV